jgi:hypothetical protein
VGSATESGAGSDSGSAYREQEAATTASALANLTAMRFGQTFDA